MGLGDVIIDELNKRVIIEDKSGIRSEYLRGDKRILYAHLPEHIVLPKTNLKSWNDYGRNRLFIVQDDVPTVLEMMKGIKSQSDIPQGSYQDNCRVIAMVVDNEKDANLKYKLSTAFRHDKVLDGYVGQRLFELQMESTFFPVFQMMGGSTSYRNA